MIVSDTYIQQILSLSSCVADPGIALVNGILEPLRTLKCTGKLSPQVNCVIVVDGLCEAEIHRPDHGDTIGTFLSHYLLKFPSWLKIICTVRSSMQDVTRTLPFQTIRYFLIFQIRFNLVLFLRNEFTIKLSIYL